MSSNDVCEIKSIRTDIVDDIAHKMKDDDIVLKTCNLFKILGDANRVKIILALQYDELCVCELSLLLDMSQSSISHQLKLLRLTNIVKSRKVGKEVFYTLDDEHVSEVFEVALSHIGHKKERK